MLIFGTNIGLKLLKIKVATILNIDMNFFLLEDILVLSFPVMCRSLSLSCFKLCHFRKGENELCQEKLDENLFFQQNLEYALKLQLVSLWPKFIAEN